MEPAQEHQATTLAYRLGECPHISPLLRKVVRVRGCPADRLPEWLLRSAVLRGARHYQRSFSDDLPPDTPALSDEEIGVALCLGEHPYQSVQPRAAAQVLSSPHTDAPRLARLAVMERVEPVLSYVAGIACYWEPGAHPWAYLLRKLAPRRVVPPEALPHGSRFVSQTGVTAQGGGPQVRWLWRRESA